MIEVINTRLSGCFQLHGKTMQDARGSFRKIYQREVFKSHGLNLDWREQYFSTSLKGVIRGMHFQTPPYDHIKLVYCTAGEVLDVVVDLRMGSPTYGEYEQIVLSDVKSNAIYIPSGLAHGFCVLSETATMVYNVSTEYVPLCDSGIRWNSFGVLWPAGAHIISDRDKNFLGINEFFSPFEY